MLPPSGANKDNWPPPIVPVLQWRQQQLAKLRNDPKLVRAAKVYYAERPADFILHWVDTVDPRVAGSGRPARMPLQMFPRQVDLVDFLEGCVQAQTDGLIEKARDMGATWVCCGYSAAKFMFAPGSSIGWGSRKADLVDRLGDMDSIFEKIRTVIRGVPSIFWPEGFDPDRDMNFMRIACEATGSSITGESGDNIGRGGRKLIYFKDESAHYERPDAIEAALADNTNVQIDLSSVNGTGNVFHRRREAGIEWNRERGVVPKRTNVFVMGWSDHPGKTREWYEARKAKAEAEGLMHVFAQEVDRDYSAAVEGIIIPADHVKAAIDAHVVLGLTPSGPRVGALDVADEGLDVNCFGYRRGFLLEHLELWNARDTGVTARNAIRECELAGCLNLQYDSIGIGSGIKAEANRLRDEGKLPKGLKLIAWNAGAAVLDPDENISKGDPKSPKNEDFYHNLSAQAAWALKQRFYVTWRAVNEPGFAFDPDEIISISSMLPHLHTLVKELSQPTQGLSASMKVKINKKPEGTKSPNAFDMVKMAFFPVPAPATARRVKVKIG